MINKWLSICFLNLVLLITNCFTCAAGQGVLGVDRELNLDQSGVWARKYQLGLEYGSAAAVLGGALWLGSESRLGQTFWKSTDSMLVADVSATVLKEIFRRQRPVDGNDSNSWFGSSKNASFPSGEVTHITSIATPFIAEYHQDNPAVWALALLPIYDGEARLKSQAHWQSDVIAGMALGVASGLWAHNENQSFAAGILPRGFSVEFRKSFN